MNTRNRLIAFAASLLASSLLVAHAAPAAKPAHKPVVAAHAMAAKTVNRKAVKGKAMTHRKVSAQKVGAKKASARKVAHKAGKRHVKRA